MARLSRLLCVGTFLVAASESVAQPPPGAAPLRLGSWNIEHLGSPGTRRGSGEGVLQEAVDLARYLRHARLDVLALQEITADAEAPEGFPRKYRTSNILHKALRELNRTAGQDWRHILFPRMRAADTTQWVGVAWNAARITPVGDIVQVPISHTPSSQDSNRWDRNLHAMMFSAGKGKTDFVVLVVHLKANSNASFARHRGEEIEDLVGRLPQLRRAFPGEQDFILVGDTNILDAGEPAVRALEQAGFRDLNKLDTDTHTAKGGQPFDRIFVPRNQEEFARSSLEVLAAFQKQERLSFAEFRARYSDHYIVAAPILIMADDD